MNREQRRAYNKAHGTKHTREDFALAEALHRIKQGNISRDDIAKFKDVIHMDNELVAPNGCEVKLNYENIYSRPQEMLTDEFKEWVEANKDAVFHITRDGSKDSLVCFEEDERHTLIDGEDVIKPKWLFDLYSDLLIKSAKTEEFKPAFEIEDELGDNEVNVKNYTDITDTINLMDGYLKHTDEIETKEEEKS